MSDDSRKLKSPSHPTSLPPEVSEIDASWDDDNMRLELDDPLSESAFDRITAVPELPPALFAKQVMEEQAADSAPPDSVPRLGSQPPVVQVRPLDPMSLDGLPRAARAVSLPDLARVTVPAPQRPQRNLGPLPSEPTGLELADTTQQGPATSRSPSASHQSRDPRDPVLELDLGEVARSGPPPLVLMPSVPASARDAEVSDMKDRYATGDFTGALVVADSLLEENADDLDAQRYGQSCRDVLTQMYSARLGSLAQRVRVAVPGDQIRWLSLDHRAGFVLSLIDGSSSVEELLDISGMTRLDALRILFTLYDQRVIALSER